MLVMSSGRAAQNIRRALPERVRASHSPTRATLARALPRVPLRFARPSAMREAPRIATRSRAGGVPLELSPPPPPAPAWVADLLGMIALSLLGIVLEFADPFERYLVAERLPEYSYPHGPQSVPTWTLPFLGIFIPLGIILLVASSSPPRPTSSSATDDPTDPGSAEEPPPASSPPLFSSELRRASAGLCLSVALGFAVTNALKVSVGAFRPDFAARCWPPDGASPRWAAPGRPECAPSANPRAVAEGRKSFPSGHASMAFSGLAYASAYVATKLRVFDGSLATDPSRASTPRLLCALAPVALAAAVAVSRERDYWHHPEDARVGSAVGVVSAGIAWALKRPIATRGLNHTHTHDAGGENAEGWAEGAAGRGPEGASAERRRRGADDGRREEGRGGALGGARDDDAADDAGRRLYPSGDVSDSGGARESLLPGTRRRGDSSGDAD